MRRRLEDESIRPDKVACGEAAFGPTYLTRTIETPNLNAKRLKRARSRQWSEVGELSAQVTDERQMVAWIRTVLSPDEVGNSAPFVTTSRNYFGPLGELALAELPEIGSERHV